MGDVPIKPPAPEPEPTPAQVKAQRVNAGVRLAVTGDTAGRLRRPVLFLVVAVALVLDGTFGLITGTAGLIALLILAMTDNVVDL